MLDAIYFISSDLLVDNGYYGYMSPICKLGSQEMMWLLQLIVAKKVHSTTFFHVIYYVIFDSLWQAFD